MMYCFVRISFCNAFYCRLSFNSLNEYDLISEIYFSENKKFDEPFIWKALFQISKALQVCHTRLPQMTLLHRDIKPANIFIDSKGNFKLGDFGLAQKEDDCNSSDNIVGTPYYMSPVSNKHDMPMGKYELESNFRPITIFCLFKLIFYFNYNSVL